MQHPPGSISVAVDGLISEMVRPLARVGRSNIAAFAAAFCHRVGLEGLPRHPARLLPALGVQLVPAAFPEDLGAAWCRTREHYLISYSRHRTRHASPALSIWHEFFEIIAANPHFPSRLPPEELERLASLFAVHVMMPEQEVRRQAADLGHPHTLNKSRVLASRFGVSVSAMRLRLRELGLEHPADAARLASRRKKGLQP